MSGTHAVETLSMAVTRTHELRAMLQNIRIGDEPMYAVGDTIRQLSKIERDLAAALAEISGQLVAPDARETEAQAIVDAVKPFDRLNPTVQSRLNFDHDLSLAVMRCVERAEPNRAIELWPAFSHSMSACREFVPYDYVLRPWLNQKTSSVEPVLFWFDHLLNAHSYATHNGVCWFSWRDLSLPPTAESVTVIGGTLVRNADDTVLCKIH